MKEIDIMVISNQNVMEHRSMMTLVEPLVIPEGHIGIILLEDALTSVGVQPDANPVLKPGTHQKIALRKHYPTMYKIVSTTPPKNLLDNPPAKIGSIILVKAVD